MSSDVLRSPSGEYRLDLYPDEIYDSDRDPNPNRRDHPVILYRGRRRLVRVTAYQPQSEISAVTDAGSFLIGDWGPENRGQTGIAVVYDASGQVLFEKRFRANLANCALSPDGAMLVVETLSSDHDDGDSLICYHVPEAKCLWKHETVISPTSWVFEDNMLWAIVEELGRFAFDLNGNFIDSDKFDRACIERGRFHHYEPAVRSWITTNRLDEERISFALKHADRLLAEGLTLYEHQKAQLEARVFRFKGELLEVRGDAMQAARCFRTALTRDPKVGVKRRLSAIEKTLDDSTVNALKREIPLETRKATTKRAAPSDNAPLRLVAFDVETTGLDPESCEIIEIAGVKFCADGTIQDTFSMLAKPAKSIPAVVSKKTGITDSMVKDALPPWQAVRQFVEWVGSGATLVAHNAPFDCKFFRAVHDKAMTPLPNWTCVDTLAWARSSRLDVPNYRLGTLVKHLGKSTVGLHRALADAQGTAALASHLASQLKNPAAGFNRRARTLVEAAHDPASSRQLNYLRSLGAPEASLEGLEKDEASRLIDQYKAKQKPPASESSGCGRILIAVLIGMFLMIFITMLMV